MMDLTQSDLLKPAEKNFEPPSKKSLNSTTLFWHPTGPRLIYSGGMLHVSDLNPQVETRWRMSRIELVRLGLRCVRAAISS